MIPWLIAVFCIFLCWGSFLNVVGYRIIRKYPLTGRSFCPHCKQQLAWYDLIPLISWLALRGRCRNCRNVISFLYPLIEFLAAALLTLMIIYLPSRYWFGYGVFISSLLVTIRTDFEKMLISRYMTWGLIPLAFALSTFTLLPISISESILGAVFGYAVLWIIARLFYAFRNVEGMGEGDIDLLALIGSFTGILGAWSSLLFGSFLGVIASLVQMIISKRVKVKIAFGPWLSAGALIYLFFQQQIAQLIELLN